MKLVDWLVVLGLVAITPFWWLAERLRDWWRDR